MLIIFMFGLSLLWCWQHIVLHPHVCWCIIWAGALELMLDWSSGVLLSLEELARFEDCAEILCFMLEDWMMFPFGFDNQVALICLGLGIGEMIGIPRIEGGRDGVIHSTHRSILGWRCGQMSLFINHTASSLEWARHSIYALHLLPATTHSGTKGRNFNLAFKYCLLLA